MFRQPSIIYKKKLRKALVFMWNSALRGRFNCYIPRLQIITLCFTCSERKICSTIKNSQNIMNMIVAFKKQKTNKNKKTTTKKSHFKKHIEVLQSCFMLTQVVNLHFYREQLLKYLTNQKRYLYKHQLKMTAI